MSRVALPNIADIRVLLVQPPCEERDALLRILKRVGFLTEVNWPPVGTIFEHADVVFVALRQISEENVKFSWNAEVPPAALVALLDFENPAIVNEAMKLNAHAVVGMPIRSFGVMANTFIALKNHQLQTSLSQQSAKLKARIESQKIVDQAKTILMRAKDISEAEAHKTLRSHAMNKRISIEQVARSVVSAEEILSDGNGMPSASEP